MGNILRVNLSTAKIKTEPLDSLPVRDFIGGKGIGAWILYNEVRPRIDPLSPSNKLILATGPLTGLGPAMAKYAVVTKSPLSNTFLDTLSGGYFGPELKFAGYDIVVIEGRAAKLVYLRINDGSVELKDATHLSGIDTFETEKVVRDELGDRKAKVASIGPAGENGVRFACISNDFGRQAGRGGAGAVMGSKNLKAIAVRGTGDISVAQPDAYKKALEEFLTTIRTSQESKTRTRYGTWGSVEFSNELGLLPTMNFQTTFFGKARNIEAEAIRSKIFAKNKGCYRCPIGCGKICEIKEGPYAGTVIEGPEYETIGLLGSNCGVDSIEVIAKANELCDRFGMDTISAGNVIGFSMECYERGVLTKDDTGGIELAFGNSDAILQTLPKIAHREAIGNILANGVKRAAEKIGKGAESFAVHTKGLEYPAWDPRGAVGMALSYATSDIGAAHTRAWTISTETKQMDRFSIKGKAELVKKIQDPRSVIHSLLLCTISPFGFSDGVKMFSAVTGMDVSENQLVKIGERIFNLTKAFNVREGFARKDDSLPKRLLEPVLTGPIEGHYIEPRSFEKMLDEYYDLREWDSEGKPTREKLVELGLRDVIRDLY